MTRRQLDEWQQYYNQEPFGYWADWNRTAIVACTVYNALQGGGKNVDDFMPTMPEPPLGPNQQRIVEEMAQIDFQIRLKALKRDQQRKGKS